MNFTIIYLIFLFMSTIYRVRRINKSYADEPKPGKVYFPLTTPFMIGLYLLVWMCSIGEYFYFQYILRPHKINLIISLVGFLMYVGVIPLRRWAASTLGKYLSPDVKITLDHKLIKEGPYKHLRHPLSLCVMIEVCGFTLIPNSYYSFLIALFIFLPYVVFRAYLEEKALIEKFGQEYLDYKKDVYPFLPLKKRSSK